ncbi:MAG: GntR family transcriptional regulator [Lachnospiraceae bacterium]|nr:GntR family transcriptional regulator [Lachnospiraceae bacterium]
MKRQLLYEVIYDDLLSGIQNGTYPPGSRLPSEKELSEQYGVSRITSKKSLEMLADENLITRMPGKGSYVLGEGNQDTIVQERKVTREREVKPHLVGVVLDAFGQAFGSEMLLGIEYECRKRGYDMLLKCTYGDMEEENRAIRRMIELGVEGIILMCVQGENYNAEIMKLAIQGFPMVLVDRKLQGLQIPFVGTDHYQAAKELTDYLIGEGHKRICFLSQDLLRVSSVAERFEGYRDSHLEHGILTNESLWVTDINSMLPQADDRQEELEQNISRMEKYIQDNPDITAFFAASLEIGVSVQKILGNLGLEQEKEVVFFDGLDVKYTSSSTHILQGEYLIGVTAVNTLDDRIKGKDVEEKHYIPHQIVYGEFRL